MRKAKNYFIEKGLFGIRLNDFYMGKFQEPGKSYGYVAREKDMAFLRGGTHTSAHFA